MTFDKAALYTRTFIPRLSGISFCGEASIPILAVFLIIFIPFAAQAKTRFITLFDSLPQDMDSIVGTNRLKRFQYDDYPFCVSG
ncbi:MAG: hypothetical protein ACLRXC_06360 [[Clostridium] leptum]